MFFKLATRHYHRHCHRQVSMLSEWPGSFACNISSYAKRLKLNKRPVYLDQGLDIQVVYSGSYDEILQVNEPGHSESILTCL